MIVTCPACQARFQYDDARFGAAPEKRFRCLKCSHVFQVLNPLMPPAQPPEEAAPAAPPPPHATLRRDRQSLLEAAGLVPDQPGGLCVSLAFLTGPQASTVKVLDKPRVLIGREEGDIITGDPETSRRHALLEVRDDGSVWLTDLQSTNGTLVEGIPIQGPTRLDHHQEFTCGHSTFLLLIRRPDEPSLT